MKQPIQITIENPCHQQWDKMTTERDGRYCSHCRKTVVDFTNYNDSNLYAFFHSNKNVCGRFLNTQLDRPINIPYQPESRLYRLTIALGLTLLFIQVPVAHSQVKKAKIACDTTHRTIGKVAVKNTQSPNTQTHKETAVNPSTTLGAPMMVPANQNTQNKASKKQKRK